MQTAPPILYKYCDDRGLDILCNLRLKFTPPNQFNDPFECAPRMEKELSRERVLEAAGSEDLLRNACQEVRRLGLPVTLDDARRVLTAKREDLAAFAIRKYPDHAAEFRRKHLDMVSGVLGLLCLSSVDDDILMWSHYSHRHTGFVVGLDTTHHFFSRKQDLVEVDYNDQRVLMGHVVNRHDPKVTAQANEVVRRKSPHWKYECEWRYVVLLKTCFSALDRGDPNRTNQYRSIDPSIVREVILGCRCELKRELLGHLQSDIFRHVKVREAAMHDEEFKLVIRDFSAEVIANRRSKNRNLSDTNQPVTVKTRDFC